MNLVIRLRSKHPAGGGPYKKRSFGTSLWRLGSAILGSAHFCKALPQRGARIVYVDSDKEFL
jgi:hypothetical protein